MIDVVVASLIGFVLGWIISYKRQKLPNRRVNSLTVIRGGLAFKNEGKSVLSSKDR